ncbi:MAG TPA: M20/M25/M40 family metallo-hydrolase, partial [Thermoanaerobaculia bacterium]|nr:M20/M25/M40 family metallo-hydrolase [Thermoanaerobaculia bacterium]
EVPAGAQIVRSVAEAATAVLGRTPPTVGQTFWMDASLFAEAGVETIVIGAHGTGAHADEEWVDLASAVQLTEILARTAAEWCA